MRQNKVFLHALLLCISLFLTITGMAGETHAAVELYGGNHDGYIYTIDTANGYTTNIGNLGC